MTDGTGRSAVVRRRCCWIETIVLVLPLGPEAIDITVQKEEQRIAGSGIDAGDRSTEACMSRPVRVSFHGAKVRVGCAKRDRLCFGPQSRRRGVGAEERAPIDALYAVSDPELQRVGSAELHRAEGVRNAEKLARENVW